MEEIIQDLELELVWNKYMHAHVPMRNNGLHGIIIVIPNKDVALDSFQIGTHLRRIQEKFSSQAAFYYHHDGTAFCRLNDTAWRVVVDDPLCNPVVGQDLEWPRIKYHELF